MPKLCFLAGVLLLIAGAAHANSQREVFQVPAGDVSALRRALGACPAAGCTIKLSAGTYRLDAPVRISRAQVTLQGAGAERTILDARGGAELLDDVADISSWQSPGGRVETFSSFRPGKRLNDSNPNPAGRGSGLAVEPDPKLAMVTRRFAKPVSLAHAGKIGFWLAAAKNNTGPVLFFLSDGSHQAIWRLQPAWIYNQWAFFQLPLYRPDKRSGPVNLVGVSAIGFSHLDAGVLYFVGPVAAWRSDFNVLSLEADQITVSALTIRQDRHNNGSAVYVSGADVSLQNLRTEGGNFGVYAAPAARHLVVQHVRITAPAQDGMRVMGPGSSVNKVAVTDSPDTGIVVNGNDSTVRNSVVTRAGEHGIHVAHATAVNVVGNKLADIQIFGIFIEHGVAVVRDNAVTRANETGVQIQGDSTNTVIENNLIRDTGKNAIDTNSLGVTITGNQVEGTGFSNGYPTVEAVCINVCPLAGTGRVLVESNHCADPGRDGLGNAYGIWVQKNGDGTLIRHNTIARAHQGAVRVERAQDVVVEQNVISGQLPPQNAISCEVERPCRQLANQVLP